MVPWYHLGYGAHENVFMVINTVWSFCAFLSRAIFLHWYPSLDSCFHMSKINEAFTFSLDAKEVNIVPIVMEQKWAN